MHAFDWPEQTLKIYIQYSTYFACNNDLCSATVKLKYPRCWFAKAPALIPLECSSNVDVEVELTHGTRLGMYGTALGCNLDF